jgi:DNA modification methylase
MGDKPKTGKANVIRIECKGADTLLLDSIEEFQGNLKKRTKDDIQKIITSIEKYGFSFPFFVWNGNGHNRCLDGHGRLQALAEMRKRGADLPLFPVAYVEAEDEEEAKQKLLRLNSAYGTMSVDSVLEFMDGLEIESGELALPSGTLMLYASESATHGDDTIPGEGDLPESGTALGDVYEMTTGETTHRVICGDSLDPEVVAELMGGGMADLLLTDPPYNVAYTGKTKDALKIKNDSMSDEDFRAFLVRAFTAASSAMKSGASFYIWHADSEGLNFRAASKEAGLETRQCIIWNKQAMVMGRQDYQWKHEPCLYGWKEGSAHSWYSDRKQTTVLSFDRPSASAEHPTMKPVELFAYQIENSTKGGDIVLDTFLGSGTTLVACEKLGRVCYGVELDPHYCDVIVARYRRWCTDNGRVAVVKRNGEALNA